MNAPDRCPTCSSFHVGRFTTGDVTRRPDAVTPCPDPWHDRSLNGTIPLTSSSHIAGQHLTIGRRYLRQLCAWCGATLVEADTMELSGLVGHDGQPVGTTVTVFPPLTMVRMRADDTLEVVHLQGLPQDFCGLQDDDGPDLTPFRVK